MDEPRDEKGEYENEDRNLQGVEKRGKDDPFFAAMAIFFFTDLGNGISTRCFFQKFQEKIDQKADGDADRGFDSDDRKDAGKRHIRGEHDGEHLIGGGKKDGNESAERDDAARIQAGSRGRKTALRDGTEQSAHSGCERSCLGSDRRGLCGGSVFKPFQNEISKK